MTDENLSEETPRLVNAPLEVKIGVPMAGLAALLVLVATVWMVPKVYLGTYQTIGAMVYSTEAGLLLAGWVLCTASTLLLISVHEEAIEHGV